MNEGVSRRGRRYRNRVIYDRDTVADGVHTLPLKLPGPIPEGCEPNWFVLALKVQQPGHDLRVIPCVGKKLTEKSPELRQWIRKLKELYPGACVEVVT